MNTNTREYVVTVLLAGRGGTIYHGRYYAASPQDAAEQYANCDPASNSGAAALKRGDAKTIVVTECQSYPWATWLFTVAPPVPRVAVEPLTF